MSDGIRVEVIYALADRQELVNLTLPEGATVHQAVEASGLLQKYPEIEPGKTNKLGIFAKLVKPETLLRDRDRVEIYRPLVADPKDVRRKRAEEGKVMKKGGGPAEEGAA
jgi:putative ubiquitin-RnfH superfamily antitoxin RatB of RatAB toxin-antitoxin module